MINLERAILIAVQAHQGQKDKAGELYILHPLRVMLRMKSETEMMVAVLHDVVEDSGWTSDDLRKEGFPEEILKAIDCLTHKSEDSYDEFIGKVKNNPIAQKVKLADLEDNMNITRISNPTEKDWARVRKYYRAWQKLKNEGTSYLFSRRSWPT